MQNNITFTASTNTLENQAIARLSADTAQQLTDKGATHVTTKVFVLNVSKPHIDINGKDYVPANSTLADYSDALGIAHALVGDGEDIIDADQVANAPVALNQEMQLGGVLVVFLPERKVGSEYYTLQELCSAYWCPAKAAE